MKKLSKITESVWGDIRKQGLGISVKEEDNVNTLDINDFFEYLNNNYRIDNCGSDFELTDGDTIFIPFCTTGTSNIKLGALYYERSEDDGNIVYTHRTIPQYIPELWNKIEKNFDLWVGEPDYERYVIINPKDTSRKVDNSYLLEVLNFIIDNLDSTATPAIFRKTTESVWGDIRKRGLGDEVRREDDINLFGPEELCDYLKKTYKTITPYDIIADDNSDGICICLYTINGNRYSYLKLCGFSKDKKNICLTDLYNRHMRETLNGAFKVTEHTVFTDDDDYYLIESYDNREITNSFFIEVLDFLLKTADILHKPRLKKKITESVWGDIRKRGLGDEVKIEDINTNIKELVPVDMGVTVLWADKDLEYKNENDASYFTYEEVEDIVKKSEWRIPTKDEYIELFKYTKKIKNTDNVFITEGDFDDKPQLIFNKKGYMYGGDFNTINYISHYCAWTSTPHEPEGYYMVDINHLPVPGYFSMHYLNKGCIRLVKDRK